MIIKHTRVRVEERADEPTHERASGPAHETTVRLLRDGDVVHALEITCACGELTVVELTYAEGAVAGTHAPAAAPPIKDSSKDPAKDPAKNTPEDGSRVSDAATPDAHKPE